MPQIIWKTNTHHFLTKQYIRRSRCPKPLTYWSLRTIYMSLATTKHKSRVPNGTLTYSSDEVWSTYWQTSSMANGQTCSKQQLTISSGLNHRKTKSAFSGIFALFTYIVLYDFFYSWDRQNEEQRHRSSVSTGWGNTWDLLKS